MRNSAVNILVSSYVLKLVNVTSFKIALKIIMDIIIENKGESQKMKFQVQIKVRNYKKVAMKSEI